MKNIYDYFNFDDYLAKSIKEDNLKKKYQEFFKEKLKEYGKQSINEMTEEERKKFFIELKKEWAKKKNEKE